MERGFGAYHPVVNMLYFAGAIIFGMIFVHPLFLFLSLVMAVSFLLSLKGRAGIRLCLGMSGIFAAVALINPLFNPRGATVLFTYFGGRTYTLEALLYGMAAGTMFYAVCLWFACYNEIMTSDKFLYLFGRFAPSVTLVLCMLLRYLPNLKRRADMAENARKCIGKSADEGRVRERLEHGMSILSVLTSWSLEGAAVTADSMNSRGYGSAERSSFTIYRRTRADWIVTALLVVCGMGITGSAFAGGMRAEYLPCLQAAESGWAFICGSICYGIFLSIPLMIHIWEEIVWHISKSKI